MICDRELLYIGYLIRNTGFVVGWSGHLPFQTGCHGGSSLEGDFCRRARL